MVGANPSNNLRNSPLREANHFRVATLYAQRVFCVCKIKQDGTALVVPGRRFFYGEGDKTWN